MKLQSLPCYCATLRQAARAVTALYEEILADSGLQPIDGTGQKFDPNLHEAIAHEPSEKFPEGIVVRQTRRGYRMKDRLLRPSSVVVSSGP